MAAWFYVDDQHGLTPCSYTSSHELELALKKRQANPVTNPQCVDVAMGGVLYTVDVLLWEQFNPATKRIRALRRLECPPQVCWEAESSLDGSLFATPGAATAAGGYVPLQRYWCVVLEYLKDRLGSGIHKHWSHSATMKLKSDRGDVTVDVKTMEMLFSSFGGLVTTKGKIRRIIQAVDDDMDASTGAAPAKRSRVDEAVGAAAPSRVPKSTVDNAATPQKRGPIPATLLEDTPDSKAGPPDTVADEEAAPVVHKRGPGYSHVEVPVPPAPPVTTGWVPPGWAGSHPPSAAAPPPPAPSLKRRLLFPSFSTAVFMFDLALAAKIACASIANFLATHPKHAYPWVEICLIDAPRGPDTETVRAFKHAWGTVCPHGEDRFQFITADVSSFAERGAATFIANASNSSFNGGPSTGGFNRALYVAAGDKELQADTRALYPKGGSVGPCFEVPLRNTSPLYADGTRYILHVVGPNMNPTRPNCLHGDYTAGSSQLKDCYDNMLSTYASLALKM